MTKNYLVPNVIVKTRDGERGYDIYSRLLEDRIIFIDGEINEQTASVVVAQLIHLANEDSKKDIQLYINSPGGSVYDGLAIYDTMQYIKPEIQTVCLGQAASAAAVLLAAGSPGKRLALPNARVMIHQPAVEGGAYAQASDIAIQADEIQRMREWLEETIAFHCKQPVEQVRKDIERDKILTAQQALEYGLVDQVLTSRKVVSTPQS